MKTVNASHDVGDYGQSNYMHDVIFDGNNLYQAMCDARKGSNWKSSVQKYCMDWLINLGNAKETGTDYEYSSTYRFKLKERGKTRIIDGETFSDRVISHSLCDYVINPAIQPKLIYDNCASIKGKGVKQARDRLVTHLSKFYRKNQSNQGYILLIDFEKYYDNIRYDVLMNMLSEEIKDKCTLDLIYRSIERGKVDVSYMNDSEFATCMNRTFNSLEYENVDKTLLTGEKYMYKHMNIGNQISQSAGILYSYPIDNYIKTVKSVKYYARYNDDSYVIHEDKEFLVELLEEISLIAKSLGIFINKKKTRICRLDSYWRFLQIQYSLTETGRIVRKINPKHITRQRRKMKKLVQKLNKDDFENWFKGWFFSNKKYMSNLQKRNMKNLYKSLVEVNYGKYSSCKRSKNNRSNQKRR